MGKSQKPLKLYVDDVLLGAPELQEMAAKGNEITQFLDESVDIILSPRAWRMTPELLKYLPIAVKAARDQKYHKKGAKHDESE